jgi:ABC-type transporter MlaC component
MYQTIARFSLLLALLVFGPAVSATRDDARDFVANLTRDLEAALMEARQQGLLEDQQHLDGLIDEHILPYVDRETLCKRTYRLALAAYNGQQIEVSDSTDKGRYRLVRTRVHGRDDGHTIDLALRRIDDDWRIFDLSVDGVVVSKTLNGSIQRLLEEDDIDAVIRAIDPQSAPRQD